MKTVTTLLAVFWLVGNVASAQDEFIPDTGQATTTDKQKTDEEKKLEEQLKKYEETLKDSQKFEGFWTLYLKKKDLFLELDPSQLGKYWFMQAALSSGADPFDFQAGMPIGREFQAVDAFRFHRQDEEIWLYVPNLAWRWEQRDPMATAASRSFPEAVLGSYKIEAEHPQTKKMLVKVNDLFLGDLFDLSSKIAVSFGRPYQLDRGKSRVNKISSLPENVLIRMDLYYTAPRGSAGQLSSLLELLGLSSKSHLADDRSLPLKISYLIYPPKESDYMPRLSDPRIGYFTQDFYDHGRFMQVDRTTRLINRWNIKKKDPDAKISDPVQPIVWYIDDSVPEKWREACKEGILRWNKAFEAIGISNAIEVRMKPEDADWDHADMRYNVLRFVASEDAGYAVALFRTNPFTGEIVNASITCDANMVMYVGEDYEKIVMPAKDTPRSAMGKLVRREEESGETLKPCLPGWHLHECSIGQGKLRSATFGWRALEALNNVERPLSKDEYVKAFLADLVAHEMGHCLGLRHNFAGSTELTLSELSDPAKTARHGTSASVMDYVPVNIAAVANGKGDYFAKTIGTYDILAIEYGYADVPGITPESQALYLAKIAAKGSLPGGAYMTDENADSFDPYVVRWDFSQKPLEAAAVTIQVAKKLLSVADKLYPREGRPYSDLTRAVMMSIRMSIAESSRAVRFVGGLQGRRNFRGDPNERPTLKPVDAALQRQALNLIARELLSEQAFKLSNRILLNLSSDLNSGTYSDQPIKDAISSFQLMVLSELLSADTVDRVANNAYKMGSSKNRFTLADLYGTIAGVVFSEVGTGREIGPLRRDLQRFAIEALITQALARPGQIQEDARMIAWDILVRLRERFAAATCSDAMTSTHLRDCARRIDRVLKSAVTSPR